MQDAELEQLAREFLPNCRSAAWRMYSRLPAGADLDEIISCAHMALAEALARWDSYCAEKGYDPSRRDYLAAYVKRRVDGAILDWCRGQDWLTRSSRTTVKALQTVAEGLGRPATTAELAGLSGVPLRAAERALAAADNRPVSLDAVVPGADAADNAAHQDLHADVESAAIAASLLDTGLAAFRRLDEAARLAVVLRVYEGLPMAEVAGVLGLDYRETLRLYESACLAIHDAMSVAAVG